MALTQDELDQVYNYVMGKGQSLAGLPDGGSDLSSMYLAPLLKYSPGGKATLVRLAVSVLKGDSAYQVWVNEPGNAGKTLSDFFLSIKGAKGDPFTFADFTPEQLADLALTYDKLTPEQKEEMKLHFGDLTEADILVLQKPATDAADEVREQMTQISQDASAAIKAASDAAGNAQDAADNVQDGKTTQFEIGTVESGAAPSASLTDNGVDATGNPKKKLNLVMQKGDNAKSPTVQTGTITAGDPASEVTFTFTEAGMTEDGRPIWRADGSIPRGQQGPPGTGSGNVSVDGTGLVIGKKYLFVPSSDDSTAGTFVEYVAPEIPEQVQPDWNATEGKGAILHKPGDATADASGLMSADQFQKLEKLNPSYLSNDVTGKKVEYTDAGKLLFEGKETFAVDADSELTLAGKKLSELGGGGSGNTYELPAALMTLIQNPSTATSESISEAIGGDNGLNQIITAIQNKALLYIATNSFQEMPLEGVSFIVASMSMTMEGNIIVVFMMPDINKLVMLGKASEVYMLQVDELYSNPNLYISDVSDSTTEPEKWDKLKDKINQGFYILNGHSGGQPTWIRGMNYPIRITNLDIIQNQDDGLFRLLFNSRDVINNKGDRENYKSLGVHFELGETGYGSYIFKSSGSGTKALMDDGTYKAVGGNDFVEIPFAVLELTNSSTSDQIKTAFGGDSAFDDIHQKIKSGKMAYCIFSAEEAGITMAIPFIADGGMADAETKALQLMYINPLLQKPEHVSLIFNKSIADNTYTVMSVTNQLSYDLVTTGSNGLMSSTDKAKMDRLRSYTTATTVASLNVNYEVIYVTLSANASLSVSGTGTTYDGRTITAYVYCSSARTITIPTSGSYISMCGSSFTCPAGKWVEFNLTCIAGIWHIAKLEQE